MDPNRCYYNGQKRNYMGTVNRTEDGYPCQGWDVQYPHEHNYQQTDFPDGRFPDNYCRTTSDSSMPWCYARTGRKRWSYCNIVNCACPAGLFGHNCAKMCHCTEKGEKCDSILGMCKSGCAVGWSGFDCQTPTACAENKYGWSCESECKCRNSRHCDRFSGPTSECQCKQGFFNPPQCEPVTPPSIVEFSNEQVNPGQPAEFNCTVSAFPMPMESEIRLLAPEGRKVELMRSTELEYYMRKNTFRVDYVQSDEKYSCFVQATAGTTILTAFAKVFELPRLNAIPGVVDGTITAHNATIEWRRWSPDRGDPGDPNILWYNVFVRGSGQTSYRKAGMVVHTFCRGKCRYVLTGLQPNTRYSVYVSVRRDGEGGDGPPGPIFHLTTKCAAPSLPPAIDKMTARLQHNASYPQTVVILTWNLIVS
nr:hypothetical protein BaRGS_009020 [Batillaria attramentaria]